MVDAGQKTPTPMSVFNDRACQFSVNAHTTTTITTVGYGDISPTTSAGRLVAGVTMLVGISAFAVVTAKVAEVITLR